MDGTANAESNGGDSSLACGRDAQTTGFSSTALGYTANINATDSTGAMAIGYRSVVGAAAPGAIALSGDADSDGVGAQATAANAIALGAM